MDNSGFSVNKSIYQEQNHPNHINHTNHSSDKGRTKKSHYSKILSILKSINPDSDSEYFK